MILWIWNSPWSTLMTASVKLFSQDFKYTDSDIILLRRLLICLDFVSARIYSFKKTDIWFSAVLEKMLHTIIRDIKYTKMKVLRHKAGVGHRSNIKMLWYSSTCFDLGKILIVLKRFLIVTLNESTNYSLFRSTSLLATRKELLIQKPLQLEIIQ